MEHQAEQKQNNLQAGLSPIYDEDGEESLQERLEAKVSQYRAELTGAQTENMELVKKLQEYEHIFSKK